MKVGFFLPSVNTVAVPSNLRAPTLIQRIPTYEMVKKSEQISRQSQFLNESMNVYTVKCTHSSSSHDTPDSEHYRLL